jgi:toxin HigB-1
MEVEFEDSSLLRLEQDATYDAGHDSAIVRKFRMRMQTIRAAVDERVFYELKSLHYEKLKGDRAGQRSMRLNDQWRLILKLKKEEDGKAVAKVVVIVSIADYH